MTYFVKQYQDTELLCEGAMSLSRAIFISDLEIEPTEGFSYEFYLNGKPVYPVYGVYKDAPMFTVRFSNLEGLIQDVPWFRWNERRTSWCAS
tara:strand:+ start:106 stop:381 length:276 start_codon:yes stop_codon:yes gene_type:complete